MVALSFKGLGLILLKKSYWKAVFRKHAFLNIGKRAHSKEIVTSNRTSNHPHSKLLGKELRCLLFVRITEKEKSFPFIIILSGSILHAWYRLLTLCVCVCVCVCVLSSRHRIDQPIRNLWI